MKFPDKNVVDESHVKCSKFLIMTIYDVATKKSSCFRKVS